MYGAVLLDLDHSGEQSKSSHLLGMGWRSSSTCSGCPSHQPKCPVTATAPSHRTVSTCHQPPHGFSTTWQHRKSFVFPAPCFANKVKPPGADHSILHHFSGAIVKHVGTLSWDRHSFVRMTRAAATAPSGAKHNLGIFFSRMHAQKKTYPKTSNKTDTSQVQRTRSWQQGHLFLLLFQHSSFVKFPLHCQGKAGGGSQRGVSLFTLQQDSRAT